MSGNSELFKIGPSYSWLFFCYWPQDLWISSGSSTQRIWGIWSQHVTPLRSRPFGPFVCWHWLPVPHNLKSSSPSAISLHLPKDNSRVLLKVSFLGVSRTCGWKKGTPTWSLGNSVIQVLLWMATTTVRLGLCCIFPVLLSKLCRQRLHEAYSNNNGFTMEQDLMVTVFLHVCKVDSK